jgi:AhpC/TSA antioxidant enzyme
LRDREEELRERKVEVAVVTFEAGPLALGYAEETSLQWPLLVDADRALYREYGMLSASLADVWGPATWWAYLKAILGGERLKKSEGDLYQRGGDVLVDPAGVIRLHHVGKGPADRPSVDEILARVVPP